MTWLSFCARRPGPEWKTGYGMGDRTLAQIEGVVDHSMEGSLAAAYGVLDGPRQASWTFSIPKVGEPIQHYSLEKIPWHAGVKWGNVSFVGKEVEGKAGEPWTANQIFWSARIDVALRQLCPAFGGNPPTLRLNQWEHNWLSATSCPSGRNPWEEKFALINELEDGMNDKDWERMAGLLRGVVWAVTDGQMSTGLKKGDPEWAPKRDLGDVMNAIAGIQAGSGATDAQIEAVVLKVLKRQKLVVD